MARYAIVENGLVVNVVTAEQPLESNWIQCDGIIEAQIDSSWNGVVFTLPVIPPQTTAQFNAEIQTQIDAIESKMGMSRAMREFAISQPNCPSYIVQVNNQIVALRGQFK